MIRPHGLARFLFALALTGPLAVGPVGNPVMAQSDASGDLRELLEEIRARQQVEQRRFEQRVERFLEQRNARREMVQAAEQRLETAEAKQERLLETFDANNATLAEQEEALKNRSGDLSELFGAAQQAARELRAVAQESLISAQHPDRLGFLETLATRDDQPTIEQLRRLWLELSRETIAAGEVVRFTAPVIDPAGTETEQTVVRVGVFNAVSGDEYLRYDPEVGQLVSLAAQPPGHQRATAAGLTEAQADAGPLPFALDPTRGQLLSLLIQRPGLLERLRQGGIIGYIILALGVVGLGLVIERAVGLTLAQRRLRRQLAGQAGSSTHHSPLGEVIARYAADPETDWQTLELELDQAILKERPRLQRRLPLIKLIAAVAPLLGLLGTVTGMIQTFQDITLFGTGDPRLMADGISQALVTTALGLSVAVTLIVLHTLVNARSRGLVEVLEEQVAGLIAQRAVGSRGTS
jgi:biopolymer transport protein ExbB